MDMHNSDHIIARNDNAATLKAYQDKTQALRNDGVLALRMKLGDGAVWSKEKIGEPRYFYYWQIEPLKQMIVGHGFEWVAMTESFTSHNNASWAHIIARKV